MPLRIRPIITKLMLALTILLAASYVGICLLLFFFQSRLMFSPPPKVYRTPADLKLHYQDVWLSVATGSKIERFHGWWIAADSPKAITLLYLHGKGANGGAVNQAAHFHRLGYSILLIDYRGYGLSEGGFPTESQVDEDAETAWNYLVRERRISPKQIVVYGYSLGGAIAIDLAVKHPEARALIVQSSFTSMADMAKYQGYFWWVPINLLLNQRFDSIAKVKFLKIPVLFIHGAADDFVPTKMSQALYNAASQPKQLLLVPQTGHNDGEARFNTPKHFQSVQRFIQQDSK